MKRQNRLKIQRRRRKKLFWLFAAFATSTLLYDEQAAALYLISALALWALMLVVAFSSWEARDAGMQVQRS